MRRLARHLPRDQRGFTLPEVLVAMVMMLTVMFALYSIFDMSLRVFSYGNDKTEAVEQARTGLERMEREIRAAQVGDDGKILVTGIGSTERIRFQHQGAEGTEDIVYRLPPDSNNLIRRDLDSGGGGAALAEYVTKLQFQYYKQNGDPPASEADVSIVRIELTVERQGVQEQNATQTLTTDVHLRNRSDDV